MSSSLNIYTTQTHKMISFESITIEKAFFLFAFVSQTTLLLFNFSIFASDALYESINFDRDLPTKSTTTTTTIDDPLAKVPVPKMRRQNAVAQNPSTESDEKQKRGKCSKSFVVGMIPPPPPSPSVTSLPKDANTDDDDDDDLAEFSAETMQKLNKLYEMRNFLRSSSISGAEPNETNDFDEVVYRMRDFKDFSRRSKRGSSKPMCSLVSVSISNTQY